MKLTTLISALAVCLLLAGCGKVSLYNGLTEAQANEVTAALLTAGVSALKRRSDDKDSWMVSVDEVDMAYAMQVLNSQGLPSERFDTLGEVFKKKGFVSSPLEEKARYLHGLSQELAHTLAGLQGVHHARVHIAMPERDYLSDEGRPSSASVVIVAQRDADINHRETDIKAIVKDSIEGLDDVNKVTVKFFPAPTPAPERPTGPEAVTHLNAMLGPGVLGLLLVFGTIPWLWTFWRSRRKAAVAGSSGPAKAS